MSYRAFALKYRPQKFDEVVGQEHVVVPLKNAIIKDRVHHAYLFAGPRGVGKTSLARILAKSLNCLEGPAVIPCGKCSSCVEINRGTSLDIIEIDGASNRGIDEIRVLRENIKLTTAYSRYKIYIIDEVHMLTQEAFNALLKTLEEPPSHVKFIFATTHPQKVLPTILSRCQKFQFNLVPIEKITDKLKQIGKAENVQIDSGLLYAIGRAAGGSIRDAESLLDQIFPVILEKGIVTDVLSFLGIIDEETLNTVLKGLVEKDLTFCLDFIDKILKDGKDLGVFLNSLIEHLRNLLLAKVSLRSFKELIELSPQSKDLILKLAQSISTNEVMRLIDLLIEANDLSRQLNSVRIPLELAVIKFSYSPQEDNNSINNLKTVVKDNTEDKKEKIPVEDTASSTVPEEDLESQINELDMSEKPVTGEVLQENGQDIYEDNMLQREVKIKWKDILSSMQKVRAAIASHLSFSEPVSSCGKLVKIAFAKKDYFHKESVETSKNLKFIEEAFSKFMNKAVSVKFVIIEDSSLPSNENSSNKEKEDNKVVDNTKPDSENNSLPSSGGESSEDDFINNLMDTFGVNFENNN